MSDTKPDGDAAAAATEIESPTQVYGTAATALRAIDSISLSVPPGQIFGHAPLPLDRSPSGMADFGRFTPISPRRGGSSGFLVARKVSRPSGGDGGWLRLTGISLARLLLGIAVVSLGESAARRQGSLGRY